MCLQGIRLGRKTICRFWNITIGATQVQLVQGDPNRTNITFSVPNGLTVCLGPFNVTWAVRGFTTDWLNPPLDFNIERHGEMVTMPWFGLSALGATTVTVCETVLLVEK